MRLILCLLFFISNPAFAESISGSSAVPAASNSRLMRLMGTVAYQDGPNCLNAAAYLHGFVDTINTVGDKEFEYYLRKFCRRNFKAIKAGDIIVRYNGRELLHAATSIDRDTIVQKNSLAGVNGNIFVDQVKTDASEATYNTMRIKDSIWFNGKTNVGRIEVYECDPPESVAQKIEEWRKLPATQLADRIRAKLEAISLSKETFNWLQQDKLRRDLDLLAHSLHRLDGKSEAHKYVVEVADSIELNASYFPKPHPSQVLWTIVQLRNAVKQLQIRINSKNSIEASSEH